MKDLLITWEAVTNNLADAFVEKHFGKNAEMWWIANETGGVLSANDHFFSLEDIVEFTRHRYSSKKMFEYYQYALDCTSRDPSQTPISIKNYKKLL